MEHFPLVIGSRLVTHGSMDLTNPATGQVFATVAEGTRADVFEAVEAAKAVQPKWAAMSLGERSNLIMKLANALEERAEVLAGPRALTWQAFATLESTNAGKALKLAKYGDVPFSVDNLRYFAGAVRRQEGAAAGEYASGYTSMLRREPLGVVGLITPWNYPLMMAVWKLGPAIAAGNTAVLKPAPNTPATTILLAKLALEVGIPAGVINIVTGGVEVGEAICTHPDIRMVSFTGSTATGQRVAALASPLIKRVTLELGGKAPFVVFADADLDAAAQGAVAACFMNAGQDCTAATRIYVEGSVRDAFVAKFLALVAKLVVGDPSSLDTDMGPLSSQAQRAKVDSYVQAARKSGVQVLAGGVLPQGPGYFYPATVLADASEDAPCVREEIFGPVVVVNRFTDEADAVAKANGVPYGLAASVWTSNVQRAMRLSGAIQAGTVWVNDHLPIASEMPHGGYKSSGIGKDMSHYALEEFTQVKHVMLDTTGSVVKPWHGVAFGKL